MKPEEFNETISFLKEVKPEATKASMLLWTGTAIAFILHLSISMMPALSAGASGAKLVGSFLGACFWPVVVTALTAHWNKTQKGRVKVFFGTCLVLLLLSAVTVLSVGGYMNLLQSRR